MRGKVYERNGYWYIQLDFKDKKGKRHQPSRTTSLPVKGNKKRAEAEMQKMMDEYRYQEEMEISEDVSVSDFVRDWLSRQTGQRDSTLEGYAYRANKIINYPPFKTLKIGRLTSVEVNSFCSEMLKSGKKNQKTGKEEPLAVRTVREYKNILSAACDDAIAYKILETNPARAVKVTGKRNRDFEEEMLFLTVDELNNLINYLKGDIKIDDKPAPEHYHKLAPMAYFCGYYGLRRSELLGLTWSAVSFSKKTIRIGRTVTRVTTTHEEDDTKSTSSKRTLPLSKTAIKVLQDIQAEQARAKEFYGKKYHQSDYVFTWDDGRTYDPNYITRTFNKATADFGRPEITLHKLRHSCATLLLDQHWDIKKVQHWLGHSDATVTLNIYAHYIESKNSNAADDIEDLSAGINF